jgi:hypothetical protein
LNQPRSSWLIFNALLQLPHTTFCDHSDPTEMISIEQLLTVIFCPGEGIVTDVTAVRTDENCGADFQASRRGFELRRIPQGLKP